MPAPRGNPKPAYFDPAYTETKALLERARNYAALADAAASGNPRIQIEALRVTARLTHVMSWLMVQRAVAAGEISPREALQCFPLSDRLRQVCNEGGGINNPALPATLLELLAASAALYNRIRRLEQLVIRFQAT